MASFIVKILRRDELDRFRKERLFAGSPDDLRDGFIHLSTPIQTAGTLAKHFVQSDGQGVDGLSLLFFNPEQLGPSLRWEASRGGELFPHYYGVLSYDVVCEVVAVERDGDGQHILPERLSDV